MRRYIHFLKMKFLLGICTKFIGFFCLLLSCQRERGEFRIKKSASLFSWYLNPTLLAFFPGVLLSFLDLLFLSIAKLDTAQCRIFTSVVNTNSIDIIILLWISILGNTFDAL